MNIVYIITGVSGSGKSTVGNALALNLQIPFFDGDDFHPQENIDKMSSGIPLDDADRYPWLLAMNVCIKNHIQNTSLIIACSALKEQYRHMLTSDVEDKNVFWIHLQGNKDVLTNRLQTRSNHFMQSDMLLSQLQTYEEPKNGLIIDINQNLEIIIQTIKSSMSRIKTEIGIIGLGVMGTSLARNIASKNISISLYNRHVGGKEENIAKNAVDTFGELQNALPFDDLEAFVQSLASPKKVFLMVNAGKPVDDIIQKLIPLLGDGDVIVDGGNSLYKDTSNRANLLTQHKILYLGAGVSGGEEGALMGPSIMPGGDKKAFEVMAGIFQSIAAKNEHGEVCCAYIGEGGAGHFVKMVHNGIEYAEMQLIAEIYSHLRYNQDLTMEKIANIFEEWNQGDTANYLLGITVDILRFKDKDGSYLLDHISDEAGNKGTGGWTTIAGAELGVPIPSITEALFARYLSSYKADRLAYSYTYPLQNNSLNISIPDLKNLYQFCRLINHAQGIKLIQEASHTYNWSIQIDALLTTWSGGCIIRSKLLEILRSSWGKPHQDILLQPSVVQFVSQNINSVKASISQLVLSKQSFPVITSSLEYFNYLTTQYSNANLIQAQRDYFGAHTYRRIDDNTGKSYHTLWY